MTSILLFLGLTFAPASTLTPASEGPIISKRKITAPVSQTTAPDTIKKRRPRPDSTRRGK